MLFSTPKKHDKWETSDDQASVDLFCGCFCRADSLGARSVLVLLKVFVMQLFLGLEELAQLLHLSFAELLPFGIVSGETLFTATGTKPVTDVKSYRKR